VRDCTFAIVLDCDFPVAEVDSGRLKNFSILDRTAIGLESLSSGLFSSHPSDAGPLKFPHIDRIESGQFGVFGRMNIAVEFPVIDIREPARQASLARLESIAPDASAFFVAFLFLDHIRKT
jgi:hypothetical protein